MRKAYRIILLHCILASFCHYPTIGMKFHFHETIRDCKRHFCAAEAVTRFESWPIRNDILSSHWDWACRCDDNCKEHGDCCYDSSNFTLSEQKTNSYNFVCVETSNFFGVYMKTECPPAWKNHEIRHACKNRSAGNPVTSRRSNVTYRNSYCAICFNDIESLVYWHVDKNESSSGENVTKCEDTNSDIKIFLPIPKEIQDVPRKCNFRIIKGCKAEWEGGDIAELCESYLYIVYDKEGTPYKNPHCAKCNNVPCYELECRAGLACEELFWSKKKKNKHRRDDVLPLVIEWDTLLLFVGYCISITLLLIHLTVFVRTTADQKPSEKYIASFSISLLISYIFLAFLPLYNYLRDNFTDDVCYLVAVIGSYSLLGSFLWMLTISYDLWRVIRASNNCVVGRDDKSFKRFIVYSVWCWLVPAGIVGASIFIDLQCDVPIDWKPAYGEGRCWFGRSTTAKPFNVFIGLPFILTSVIKTAFFIHMVYTVYYIKKAVRSRFKDQLKIYLKMALTMGLAWSTYLIFVWSENLISYSFIFSLINSLQGVNIFIYFTLDHLSFREFMSDLYKRLSSRLLSLKLAFYRAVVWVVGVGTPAIEGR